MLLAVCLSFALVAGANAAPIVKLTFEDGGINDTSNLGTIGGTQYMNGYNGWGNKTSAVNTFWEATAAVAPTTVDSGYNWWSMFTGQPPTMTYGDYQTTALSALTLSAWILPNHMLSWRNVVAIESTAGGEGSAAARELGLWFEGNGALHFTGGANGNIDVAGVFTSGVWTHVALSYDSAGATKVYINGVDTAFAGGFAGGTIGAGTRGVAIGTPPTDAYGLHGSVDNILLYDTALTEAEVQSVMMNNIVPEPVTMVLLGIGALGLIRRRK